MIRDWKPEKLAITHFGPSEQPTAQLDELEMRLDHWADSARAGDRDGWIAAVKDELRGVVSPEVFESFVAAVPLDQAYAGLRRYWDKRPSQI